MIDAIFNQPNYVAAKKMLDASVLRHEAIASNIGNLEKPNYQRLDLAPSFSAEFQRACAGGHSAEIAQIQPALTVDAAAVAASHDGNTVNLENEFIQLGQNFLQHSLETSLITGSLLKLRLAISGKT